MSQLKDMKKQADLIKWIESLPENASFTAKFKSEIIAGIKKYEKNESVELTGLDLFDAEDADDIMELLGVKKPKARKILRIIAEKKQQDYDDREKAKGIAPGAKPSSSSSSSSSVGGEKFTLMIQAIRGRLYKIKDVSASTTVTNVKSRFMEELGDQAAADEYKGALSQWNKSKGKIELKKNGKNMPYEGKMTLGEYGIVNGMHIPLIVAFKVIGGTFYESKSNDTKENDDDDDDDDDDEDQYRNRKFRKQHKKFIVRTSKPDCIMGYTDADCIPRAELPCGCAFAADTMYRYMKSVFENNYRETKIICPMPKTQCKGNDKQRLWPWAVVFIISDLSEKEVMKYTKAIENRISGSKNCPHCGAVTERPDNLRISRVKCTVCNKSDWCWNCSKVWNHGGLGPICGNEDCMGAQINIVLQNCDEIVAPTEWWDIKNIGKKIATTRACPKCLSPLEYTQACKHIWCICCPHQFCFNCLGDWKSGSTFGDNECGHNKCCDYTKVQVFK